MRRKILFFHYSIPISWDGILTILIISGLILTVGCNRKPDSEPHEAGAWYNEEKLLYYGIPVRVSFSPGNNQLAVEVWEYLEKIDDVFNDYKETTEIGRVNAAIDTRSFKVSKDLAEAIELSIELHRITDGAFDITLGPLRQLWRTAETQNQLPVESELKAILLRCGLDKIKLDGASLSITEPGMKFDFGGIIKGIAVDNVVEMLKQSGVQSGMIQIGGETAAFGESARRKPYVLGIQNPIELDEIWDRISDHGSGLSISTSGNYWNPIIINEVEYYHILNPKTGWPVDTRILSVSVVFPVTGKNWLADGLTTAGTVIEMDNFFSIVESYGGEALVITRTHERTDDTVSLPAFGGPYGRTRAYAERHGDHGSTIFDNIGLTSQEKSNDISRTQRRSVEYKTKGWNRLIE